jgi:hypothetical protein
MSRPPAPAAATPRRRSLLAATAGVLGFALPAAGCSATGGDDRRPAGNGDAARGLRRAAARESAVLLARYDSTRGAHPSLAGRLGPLREETARHLAAFGGRPRSRPSPSARADASREVPTDGAAALAALAEAERRTSDARLRALGSAPPDLARLLASAAASGAAHAYLLTEEEA